MRYVSGILLSISGLIFIFLPLVAEASYARAACELKYSDEADILNCIAGGYCQYWCKSRYTDSTEIALCVQECLGSCSGQCGTMYWNAPNTSETGALINECRINCEAAPIKSLGGISLAIEDIANWIEAIAATIGVIMIIIGGIMYMTAGGSEDRAAKAKKILLYGTIGIFIALIAWGIESLLLSFFF